MSLQDDKVRLSRPSPFYTNHTMSNIYVRTNVNGLEVWSRAEMMAAFENRYGKLDYETWARQVAWHRKVVRELDTEAAAYFGRCPQTQEWKTIVPFQDVTGGHVNINWQSPENIALMDEFCSTGIDPSALCSIHNHVRMPAYQSTTDEGDEIDKPGWHITIGHTLRREVDLHARLVLFIPRAARGDILFGETLAKARPASRLIVTCSTTLCVDASLEQLRTPPDTDFPKEWMDRLSYAGPAYKGRPDYVQGNLINPGPLFRPSRHEKEAAKDPDWKLKNDQFLEYLRKRDERRKEQNRGE